MGMSTHATQSDDNAVSSRKMLQMYIIITGRHTDHVLYLVLCFLLVCELSDDTLNMVDRIDNRRSKTTPATQDMTFETYIY